MTNTSQDRERTKNRNTYAATTEGIERAKKAYREQGYNSKQIFADLTGLARSTVNKFFRGEQIELDGFQKICNKLELPWKEIEGIESFDQNGQVKQEQNSYHQTTEEKKVPFSIIGSVDQKDIVKLKIAIKLLRKLTGDDLIGVIGIEEGSIKLTLKGSQAGLERLEQLFQSGALTKIFEQELNITVEDVSFIDAQSSDNYQQSQTNKKKQLVFTIAGDVNQADINILKDALIDTSENEEKSRLIEEIKTQGAVKRNLSGVDLSGANLSGADLSDADLSGANLSDAVLYGANLSGANISDANLSDANLSDADLSDANLGGTNLSDANVKNARFADNLGISESLKQDLKARGAIFEDSPGDRSPSLTPA
jgi:uncharacterized protein YjbI with pentapeptide repeats/DNA-binding Xre family transcriptional regulator